MLLDIMMPDMDGYSVCQRIREFSQVPIIMVTARDQDKEKVEGLDIGADDYVTKPFSASELAARVRAVLRRAGGQDPAEGKLLPLQGHAGGLHGPPGYGQGQGAQADLDGVSAALLHFA